MEMIAVEKAVGSVLCHDMTQIVPGVFKGTAFKKGHVIKAEDIDLLKKMGKKHVYVWKGDSGKLHEDEAAVRLGNLCMGDNVLGSEIREGKMTLFAVCDGLLKVDRAKIRQMNAIDEVMVATRTENFMVKKGDKLAGTKVIPLVIDEHKVLRAESICGHDKVVNVLPIKACKIAIITTGSEVYSGLIEDAFGPALRDKAEAYGVEVMAQVIVDDRHQDIVEAIHTLKAQGADMILCTGGMSVDPDDRTPLAIRKSGAKVITYGAPVLPGAMFLLAYLEGVPVLGLPGCVMYAKRTVFDLVFPRLLCGEHLTKEDMDAYGHGGLCLGCDECHFPNCGFGKGH